MIWAIYVVIQDTGKNPEGLHVWQVLRKWYGPDRFPMGGGIANKQVYEIARNVEVTHLIQEAATLNQKLAENAKRTQSLLECNIY
jgi:hypothetical protein